MFSTPLLVCVILVCTTGIADAEWFADGDFNLAYDNNLSRAFNKSNRKGDIASIPQVSLGHYFQLSDSLGLSLMAEAAAGLYAKYDALNNINAGMTASLKYKQGLGPYAPWLKGYGSVKYFDFKENLRDGALISAGLLAGKRIHERINIQLGYEHQSLRANNSLFDQLSDAASVRTEISIAGPVNLLLGYSIKRGNVAVYNSPDEESVFLVNTFHTPMEIYKIRATTHTISTGLDMALTGHWSAGITADFSTVRSTDGTRYPDTVLKAAIHYSF
jgi:hypothetical protein